MYAVVKAIATILSLALFIDRTGRRKLLLISSAGTSLALWYIGAFVTARHVDLTRPQQKSVAGWVAIVCVYIYAVSLFSLICSTLIPLVLPFLFSLLETKEVKRNICHFKPNPTNTGIFLHSLERRRVDLLRRNLPHAHQRARRLPLYRLAMALPIRSRQGIALHASFLEGGLFLLFCGLYCGDGGGCLVGCAGDEGEELGGYG